MARGAPGVVDVEDGGGKALDPEAGGPHSPYLEVRGGEAGRDHVQAGGRGPAAAIVVVVIVVVVVGAAGSGLGREGRQAANVHLGQGGGRQRDGHGDGLLSGEAGPGGAHLQSLPHHDRGDEGLDRVLGVHGHRVLMRQVWVDQHGVRPAQRDRVEGLRGQVDLRDVVVVVGGGCTGPQHRPRQLHSGQLLPSSQGQATGGPDRSRSCS